MNDEELKVYQVMGNCAVNNLMWSLMYLNNALFSTPLKQCTKNALLDLSKEYQTVFTNIYQKREADELIAALEGNNRLFISYIDHLKSNPAMAQRIKEQWVENGRKIALLLAQLNPYWKLSEWSAMIQHEISLLEKAADGILSRNYDTFVNTVPVCKRLAIDMSQYMSTGIIQDRMECSRS